MSPCAKSPPGVEARVFEKHPRNAFAPAHGPRVGMPTKNRPLDVVMSYIKALDGQHYDTALELLHDRVRIRGPAGETFGKPLDFIEMLRK